MEEQAPRVTDNRGQKEKHVVPIPDGAVMTVVLDMAGVFLHDRRHVSVETSPGVRFTIRVRLS